LKEEELHIIQGLKAGRENAYAQLFEAYYKPLSVYAFKYVNDLETAKEIVQDLFVHIYDQRDSLVISSSLRSYLYQSVRNRSLNYLKHKKIHDGHMVILKLETDNSDDPEAVFRETELEYRIFQIISRLPSRCQTIFKMSRVEGKKNSEIAASLDISLRTVETQISKALRILREKLRD